uniref:Uncharacterized protein n=1 Tax=Palpitomonas bilix TaxID=652834 RepID=A0A7S3D5Q6_9EUKA|mmetsp:Transcript_23377/g.59181  ORF Transcript_23377/g.59181 Transcript_23377/m.59181 type:complete len:250 (-) Transcript_23377:253-1002(-)
MLSGGDVKPLVFRNSNSTQGTERKECSYRRKRVWEDSPFCVLRSHDDDLEESNQVIAECLKELQKTFDQTAAQFLTVVDYLKIRKVVYWVDQTVSTKKALCDHAASQNVDVKDLSPDVCQRLTTASQRSEHFVDSHLELDVLRRMMNRAAEKTCAMEDAQMNRIIDHLLQDEVRYSSRVRTMEEDLKQMFNAKFHQMSVRAAQTGMLAFLKEMYKYMKFDGEKRENKDGGGDTFLSPLPVAEEPTDENK